MKIFYSSTGRYTNEYIKGKDRIIDICKKENATKYINAEGGAELYSKDEFHSNEIELVFLKTNDIIYKQFTNDFIPRLSMLDVLMFNSPEQIRIMLNEYRLI